MWRAAAIRRRRCVCGCPHFPPVLTFRHSARGELMETIPLKGNHPVMEKILAISRKVASTDSTVLIQGESGTGKELVARYVHSLSRRATHPFIAVNCGAIPAELLES